MNRREALIGRFRAAALSRLRRVSVSLIEMEEGRGTQEQMQEVARELHTIKGESRMLGFGDISDAIHRAEERLADRPGGLPAIEACVLVAAELEVVARGLRGEFADEMEQRAALLGGAAEEKEAAAGLGCVKSPPPVASTGEAGEAEAGERRENRGGAVASDRWVQINAARVDDLCERVSAFSAELRSMGNRLRSTPGRSWSSSLSDARSQRTCFEEYERCLSLLEDISSAAWSLRLVPVAPMLTELLKHARELAHEQNKRVRVVVRGGDVEIERSILDSLWEPLLHLVRNAVDHGLEEPQAREDKGPEGMLTLAAEAIGHNIAITIADDGRGVQPERVLAVAVRRGLVSPQAALSLSEREVVDLLFTHGFSTCDEAGDLSGRGVGLDAVRDTIEGLGGAVALSSQPGKGTRFSLTVPATITRERAIVVDCEGLIYGIPSRQVLEVSLLADARVELVVGGRIMRYREEAVPLRSLQGAITGTAAGREPWVLMVELGARRFAFAVPSLLGEHDLLRQPADALLLRMGHIGGSAMLDDGRLVLILAAAGLLRKTEGRTAWSRPAVVKRQRVLVVDDSPIIRDIVSQLLTRAGLEVQSAPEGRSALAILHERTPDVVLLDVDMPGMNGFELLECIRGEGRDLPVIMFTTRFSPDDQTRAASLGADAYLVKSQFQEATLVETVRRFARQAA